MDGLTINTSNAVLKTGETTKTINRVTQPQAPGSATEVQKTFADTLTDAVNSVNQLQKESDRKMQELATGKSQNIHETMIATEKADIALKLMVQVRNKIIEAYQEIMRMQV
ncbi:MAG: flagellar hook-basal body complex protein FliE [Oligoflexia bacterium]|nr:flagellar hook-basal body complex protein FliE [Oligoflexia bacterium]